MSGARVFASRAQRGSTLGAVVFSVVLAAIAVGGYLWLTGRQARLDAASTTSVNTNGNGHRSADKWTSRLGRFLQKGPTEGTWETRILACVYTHYIAAHPTRRDVFLIARVDAEKAGEPKAVSRWLVPRYFFRAPAHLFFTNYERTEGPIQEELDDGTRCWRVHWAPRREHDGLTERIVWFAQVGGQVMQVQDRSRAGHEVRRVVRISRDTGIWNPADFDPATLARMEQTLPDAGADPDGALVRIARKAPFDVFVPEYLPPGFVLVRCTHTVTDASLNPAAGPGGRAAGAPVQLVSQLYSDGLALISLGVALRRDMDVIETLTAGMVDTDDPAACPGLPADPRTIRENDRVIRMRSDTCRTVLRRDDLGDVSVTLIGRNELPMDEYLRMIGSLRQATPKADAAPGK